MAVHLFEKRQETTGLHESESSVAYLLVMDVGPVGLVLDWDVWYSGSLLKRYQLPR